MTRVSTLDGPAAVRTPWDVIVIGAGPAGSVAARELARGGLRTLLVDRQAFPRPKVCGGCVSQRALAVLRSVGLGDLIDGLPSVSLDAFQIGCGTRHARLALPGGRAIGRDTFDLALVHAAVDVGVDFLPETMAVVGPRAGNHGGHGGRTVALSQRGRPAGAARCRVVLVADGLSHTSLAGGSDFHCDVAPSARIGLAAMTAQFPADYRPGTIYMAVGRGGYAGLVRVDGGRLNVAAALDPRIVRGARGPGTVVAALIDTAGFPAIGSLRTSAWQGTMPLTRRLRRPAAHRLLVLGDAAQYVEPFTGEGITWSLAAAVAVAPLARQGLDHWDQQLENRWVDWYGRVVRHRQRWCRILASLLRHPRAVHAMVALLAHAPALATPLVRRLHAPHFETPQELHPATQRSSH